MKLIFLVNEDMLEKMPEWRNWYTRATQNRVSQGMRVQVSPPALLGNSSVLAIGASLVQ